MRIATYKNFEFILDDICRDAHLDLIVLNDAWTNKSKYIGKEIADKFGWYDIPLPNVTSCVISKYRMFSVDNHKDVVIVCPEREPCFYLLVTNLKTYPYPPQVIMNKLKEDMFGEEDIQSDLYKNILIREADDTRGNKINYNISRALELNKHLPVIMMGNFGEPSHLDWTEKAFKMNLVPTSIQFPTSLKLFENGFVDVYRFLYPDETVYTGHTWYPKFNGKYERSDRIDFIYILGNFDVSGCEVIHHSEQKVLVGEIQLLYV